MTTPLQLMSDLYMKTMREANDALGQCAGADGDERIRLHATHEALWAVGQQLYAITQQLIYTPPDANSGVEDGRIRHNLIRLMGFQRAVEKSALEYAALPGVSAENRAQLEAIANQAHSIYVPMIVICGESRATQAQTDQVFELMRDGFQQVIDSFIPPAQAI